MMPWATVLEVIVHAYLHIVERVLNEGIAKNNRTGVGTLMIPGMMFEHDMRNGFPLLTTKRIPFRLVASELEFFIKGRTDKRWLIERGNHIWDEWCSPDVVPYGNDPETQLRMKEEHELGPVYGWQWRNFGAHYVSCDEPPTGVGIDQFERVVQTLKTDPNSRRMLVTAWNPVDIGRMALPPCHYAFQLSVVGGRLNLFWNQRSVDVALGLPFNIASYALLLHLLSREAGLEGGRLVGFLGDTHIYTNHIEGLQGQLRREPRSLPSISTPQFNSIFDWQFTDSHIEGYTPHPTIRFEIAV